MSEKEEEGKGGRIRAILLSNRATAFLKVGRFDEALRDIDASLELCQASYKALRTRARIYMHSLKYEAAISDFRDAIEQARTNGSSIDVETLNAELNEALALLEKSRRKKYYEILGMLRRSAPHFIRHSKCALLSRFEQ